MNKRAEKVEVEIEELKDSAPSANGSGVVLETESKVDGDLQDTTIEVQQEDVPAVAAALLNTDAGSAPSGAAALVVKCLGAGVVHCDSPTGIRVHLQCDSGQVLPVEMSKDAALALCRGLLEHIGAGPASDLARRAAGLQASRPKG